MLAYKTYGYVSFTHPLKEGGKGKEKGKGKGKGKVTSTSPPSEPIRHKKFHYTMMGTFEAHRVEHTVQMIHLSLGRFRGKRRRKTASARGGEGEWEGA